MKCGFPNNLAADATSTGPAEDARQAATVASAEPEAALDDSSRGVKEVCKSCEETYAAPNLEETTR